MPTYSAQTRAVFDVKIFTCTTESMEQDLPHFDLNLDAGVREVLCEAKLAMNFDVNLPDNARPVMQVADRVLSLPDGMNTLAAVTLPTDAFRSIELHLQGYHEIRTQLKSLERDLLSEKFQELKKLMSKGVNELTWTHHGIDDFIANVSYLIWGGLHPRMVQACDVQQHRHLPHSAPCRSRSRLQRWPPWSRRGARTRPSAPALPMRCARPWHLLSSSFAFALKTCC